MKRTTVRNLKSIEAECGDCESSTQCDRRRIQVEHNLDVIRAADRLGDLGPEGGEAGGEVVATGTPEEVAAIEASHTERFLAELLTPARPAKRRSPCKHREPVAA